MGKENRPQFPCKEKHLNEVIVSCYENNYASNKVIIKNGGILYKNDYEEINPSHEWTLRLKNNCYKIKLY